MTPKGMWQAGIWRTVAETHLFWILSILLLMVWTPQNLVQVGWYFILSMMITIWQFTWPAYRLKRIPGSIWVRLRYWCLFLLPFCIVQILLTEVMEWLFFQQLIADMYPELYEVLMDGEDEFSKFISYLAIFVFSFLFIAGNRLLFRSWFHFLKWVRRKLVRQFTLSHIMMLVLLFWLSAFVWLVYQVTWGMPKNLGGVNQAKEVAAWSGPLLQKKTPEEDLQRWLNQVKESSGPSSFWYFDRLTKEPKWRLYDRNSQWMAGDPPQSDEKKLVQKTIQGGVARSVSLDLSTSLAVAPVWDQQYQVVGAVVLEKRMEPIFQLSSVIVVFFLFLLVSFGGGFLFLIIAMLIASLFAYLRARVLTRRFKRVATGASEWSKGKLDYRIATDWRDELGILSEQLNEVAASLKDAKKKLEKEKEQVETILQQKKKFVADVSHELRTPVAILRGYLETEEGGEEEEKQVLFRRELDRLQHMIDELFTLSTQDEQREFERFQKKPIHPGGLLKEVYDTFQPIAWREKKVSLGLSLPEENLWISGDSVRLRQIVHNLLRNALRHTPEGGLVNLSVQEEQGCVEIAVADTGSGMSEAEIMHVFQRYYRGRVAAGEYEGAGIGLALVKEWSERMGGKIDLQSRQGEGTKVSLSFPLIDERDKS
ncbi:hypothetical protein GXN76_15085 [Kroppenstedtia pulmonis]|uniref:histidine kinase n=1 Tax=Kroppenstedtia pulmonis TaxID=1380685 RepID=A0A7D3XKH0_9BACL|nr:HAMP domain-containing sensor histidine kinase [Kroppenstedtia pulmonis]QKG85639.1 hypothetical protein GXN76_15085 [Kroppenstedtia pulmonis]